MNQTYLYDLGKKTHRGLMGRALSGMCTGGVVFGYRNVEVEPGNPDAGKWERSSQSAAFRSRV